MEPVPECNCIEQDFLLVLPTEITEPLNIRVGIRVRIKFRVWVRVRSIQYQQNVFLYSYNVLGNSMNAENSIIYFYFIFQLILDFYHSIHTRCMEKHNHSIFTYHFGVKFII